MLPLANDMVQRQESPEYQARQQSGESSQTVHADGVDETRAALRRARDLPASPWRGTGTLFDRLLEQRDVERRRIAGARMVVKGHEIKPEVNPMGIFHWYAHPSMEDIGCRTTTIYVQEIPPGSRSGVQLHQGGRLHYVWQGRGHSIIDGQRYDWQEGDEILLPLKFDGVIHQHFNDSGSEPAKLVCAEGNMFDSLGVDLGSGFEMLEPCPEYVEAPHS
jgi:hypothetical protein